jgi:hypothetical protein
MGNSLRAIGAITLLTSFTAFFLLGQVNESEAVNDIYIYGQLVGVMLILTGIAKEEQSRKLKHFIYYPIAILFALVTVAYALNDLTDQFIQTNIIIIPSIIGAWITIGRYFKSC